MKNGVSLIHSTLAVVPSWWARLSWLSTAVKVGPTLLLVFGVDRCARGPVVLSSLIRFTVERILNLQAKRIKTCSLTI